MFGYVFQPEPSVWKAPILHNAVIIQATFDWLKSMPVVATLILLMGADTASGLFLAIAKGMLNSTISWRGVSRKAIVLLIVSSAGVLQPLVPQIPVMNIIGTFYIITELISILENAGAAGVPLPNGIIQSLLKMRDQKASLLVQKGITTTTQVNVFDTTLPTEGSKKETQKLVIQSTTIPGSSK